MEENRQSELLNILAESGGEKILNKLLAEKSLMEFTKQAWRLIEPGVEFSNNWHLEYLAEELTLVSLDHIKTTLDFSPEKARDLIENDLVKRICINIPTRAMKTLLASVFFPVWCWIHNPSLKFIVVSYSQDLSMDINKKRREIIQSDWFLENWGEKIKLKQDQNSKTYFENTKQGMMFSTSIGGTITGKGADIIILDDLQNPKQAESEAERKNAIDFLSGTLPTRLNDFNKGVIINIQQRLHVYDISGYILATYPHYKFIVIPLECVEDLEYVYPLTGKHKLYKAGEVLWPDRMSREWVDQLRIELGANKFSAQQQQDPVPEGGTILNPKDFRNWHILPIDSYNSEENKARLESFKIICSWDLNFKEGNTTDNVAYSVGLTNGTSTYIVDAGERNIGIKATMTWMVNVKEKWEYELASRKVGIPLEIIVEEKANGAAVIELLTDTVPGIIPIQPLASKQARMVAISPFVEAGNIYLPALETAKQKTENQWVEEYKLQLTKFPALIHDDIPDSFSQLLDRIYLQKVAKRKPLRIF